MVEMLEGLEQAPVSFLLAGAPGEREAVRCVGSSRAGDCCSQMFDR